MSRAEWAEWAAEIAFVPPVEQTVFRWTNLLFLVLFCILLAAVYRFYELQLYIFWRLRAPQHEAQPWKGLGTLLTTDDNKAVAVSFSSFALGVCVVMSGAFDSLNSLALAPALGSAITFAALGIVLVLFAKLLNASVLSTSVGRATDLMVFEANMPSAFLDAST